MLGCVSNHRHVDSKRVHTDAEHVFQSESAEVLTSHCGMVHPKFQQQWDDPSGGLRNGSPQLQENTLDGLYSQQVSCKYATGQIS
jgi:hypothetical protein